MAVKCPGHLRTHSAGMANATLVFICKAHPSHVFALPHWTQQCPRAQRRWAFTLLQALQLFLACDITCLVPGHHLSTLGQCPSLQNPVAFAVVTKVGNLAWPGIGRDATIRARGTAWDLTYPCSSSWAAARAWHSLPQTAGLGWQGLRLPADTRRAAPCLGDCVCAVVKHIPNALL